jgi:hypothetical protein
VESERDVVEQIILSLLAVSLEVIKKILFVAEHTMIFQVIMGDLNLLPLLIILESFNK